MWIPKALAALLSFNLEGFRKLQEDLAVASAERNLLVKENAIILANSDWLRVRVNTLELERAQLIKKAYGIDFPVPEIVRDRKLSTSTPYDINADIFEDIGDDAAKKIGLPAYN